MAARGKLVRELPVRKYIKNLYKPQRSTVRLSLGEMKYLFELNINLSFLCSGVEAKRGVEFSHTTRNASRFWRKAGDGVS